MMPDGVERALADANLALEQFAPQSGWRPSALLIRGVAHALLGDLDRARDDLAAAVDIGLALDAAEDVFVAQAELALLAMRAGRVGRGRAVRAAGAGTRRGERSRRLRDECARCTSSAARVALHEGRQADARAALARAHRLRPLLDHGLPWLTVQVGLELTRAHLALGEAEAARTVLDRDRTGARAPPGPRLPRRATRASCASAWRRRPAPPAPAP